MQIQQFPNPSILSHPNIPKPLHGISPRTINGQEWWDIKRRESYAKYNYCCWACGIKKFDAKYHKWLEAHENYVIDYNSCTVNVSEITALCHSCHNFIHNGRLWSQFVSRDIPFEKIKSILEHGIKICEENSVHPFYTSYYYYYQISTRDFSDKNAIKYALDKGGWFPQVNESTKDTWDLWKLILDGKEYHGITKEQWILKYRPK